MALKDIAVHLDDSPRSELRLDIALSLAKEHGARVRGVFAQSDPNVPNLIKAWPTGYFDQARANVVALFEEKSAKAGVKTDFHAVGSGEHSYIVKHVTNAASYADLIVLGQYDPEKGRGALPADLVEQVILHAGRPALVIPYAGHFTEVGRRPLIAWNAGREAARALNDALLLVEDGSSARLVVIGNRRSGYGEAEVLEHLACHGLTAEVEHLVAEDIGVMDLLLSRVADTGSDLLVMGAHGEYGFPNLNRGSGTRYILNHMTVPVLMSH